MGYIITALAPSTTGYDSLTALVAEVAPLAPLITFRTSAFPDSIPDDNLYAANYEIKRNNHYHFCSRYNRTRNGLGDGATISSSVNWQIMRDSSNSGTGNIQFMQFIPEWRQLRLSVYKFSTPAYLFGPGIYDMDEMFSNPVFVTEQQDKNIFKLFPNPASDRVYLKANLAKNEAVSISLFSVLGNKNSMLFNDTISSGDHLYSLDIRTVQNGTYVCKISYGNASEEIILVVLH